MPGQVWKSWARTHYGKSAKLGRVFKSHEADVLEGTYIYNCNITKENVKHTESRDQGKHLRHVLQRIRPLPRDWEVGLYSAIETTTYTHPSLCQGFPWPSRTYILWLRPRASPSASCRCRWRQGGGGGD